MKITQPSAGRRPGRRKGRRLAKGDRFVECRKHRLGDGGYQLYRLRPRVGLGLRLGFGFDLGGRDQALVCGIETHVCVAQTVADLLDEGLDVQVATDAVSSRTAADRRAGLAKMEAIGAMSTSTEMALFELLGRAGTPEFKEVQGLIK